MNTENTTTAEVPAKGETKPERRTQNQRSGGDKRERRGRRSPRERVKPEFDQQILGIRRVTRVMKGGRRFSFSVTLVAGDKKGRVGVGVGKAADTALAIEKALRAAKKSMITVVINENKSIPHFIEAKYCASQIQIMPAQGRGLVAGGAVRTVLELAGITDVTSKIISRSKNGINNARATLSALSTLPKKK